MTIFPRSPTIIERPSFRPANVDPRHILDIDRSPVTPPEPEFKAPRATFTSASRGFAWSFAAGVAVLIASFIAQIVLGRILTASEYGTYAIAISFSDILGVFRDGGVVRWLMQFELREFRLHVNRAYLLTMLCSLIVAGLMVAASGIVGSVYANLAVTALLLVLSISFPIGAYSAVAQAQLQVEHKFQQMAGIKAIYGLVRYACAVILAYLGFGPICFAWAVVVASLVEAVLLGLGTRLPLLPEFWRWRECWGIFRESAWSLTGASASAVLRQVDYVVLGLLVPTAIVGRYYFAFQLVMQPVLLFNESLRKIVLPTFSQLKGTPDRETRGLWYGGVFIGTVAAPLLMTLGVGAYAVDEILWGGKWAPAVPAIQCLCVAMPLHLLSLFCESIASSHGRFRLWTLIGLARGLGTILAAILAAWLSQGSHLPVIAAVMAAYLCVSSTAATVAMMNLLKLSNSALWRGFLPPYLLSVCVGLLLMVCDPSYGTLPWLAIPILSGCFALALLVGMYLAARPQLRELTKMIQRFVMR